MDVNIATLEDKKNKLEDIKLQLQAEDLAQDNTTSLIEEALDIINSF